MNTGGKYSAGADIFKGKVPEKVNLCLRLFSLTVFRWCGRIPRCERRRVVRALTWSCGVPRHYSPGGVGSFCPNADGSCSLPTGSGFPGLRPVAQAVLEGSHRACSHSHLLLAGVHRGAMCRTGLGSGRTCAVVCRLPKHAGGAVRLARRDPRSRRMALYPAALDGTLRVVLHQPG